MFFKDILRLFDKKKGLLVFDCEFRKQSACQYEKYIKPFVSNNVKMKRVFRKDRAIKELSKAIYPLAILEHLTIYGLHFRRFLRRLNTDNLEVYRAYELLPDLIKASPETKYIITCHRSGIGKEKESYECYPNVIKTMGGISSQRNSKFIIRTINNLYGEA